MEIVAGAPPPLPPAPVTLASVVLPRPPRSPAPPVAESAVLPHWLAHLVPAVHGLGISQRPDVAGAWGAVCTDWGTAQFKVSNGDQNIPVATFALSAGTWRYVRFASFQNCGWFSCSTVRNFKKFDLANAVFGPSSAHFGGKLEF